MMECLKSLASVLTIVACIRFQAHSHTVQDASYNGNEVDSIIPTFSQDFRSISVCNTIYGYYVCATPTRFTGWYGVDMTADGDPFIKIIVNTTNPAPVCEEVEDFGDFCATVYNIKIPEMKGCVKISAPDRDTEIGCF